MQVWRSVELKLHIFLTSSLGGNILVSFTLMSPFYLTPEVFSLPVFGIIQLQESYGRGIVPQGCMGILFGI